MAENEQVIINKRDLLEETLDCINLERNIWVRFGFPKNIQNGKITPEILRNLSGPPYVFTADVVILLDKHHPNGVLLRNTTVILMHAGRTSVKSPWVFSSLEDGYPVVETVEEVNKALIDRGKKPIELVLACNNYTVDDDIYFGDFIPPFAPVYAVGETVMLSEAFMDEESKIFIKAKANHFWNLDVTEMSQKITVES